MQINIYLHKTSNAASTMAASDAPRTFHTMGELSRYYDEKFRALREEGRRIHENYVENRRKLNEQRRREGASPEKYRHRFSLLRERYYSQGRDIWLRRLSLGSKYCHDEAKFSLELEKKKRKEKEERSKEAGCRVLAHRESRHLSDIHTDDCLHHIYDLHNGDNTWLREYAGKGHSRLVFRMP